MRRLALPLLLLLCCLAAGQNQARAEIRAFSRFSVDLPEGWDGEERIGIIRSESTEEYMLTLGLQDREQKKFLAQVSIFLLPNQDGSTGEAFAQKLAELQANTSIPRREGSFWVFTGEPRSQTLKAPAITRVNVTPTRVLIIIAQDPGGMGAESVFSSLRGLTPEARELLGR